MEERDGIREEDHRDDDRQTRQVPLDYVRAALRRRREAHPAEPGVATGMHEDQTHERHRNEHVEDRRDLEPRHERRVADYVLATSRIAPTSSAAIRSFVTAIRTHTGLRRFAAASLTSPAEIYA